MDKEDFKKNFKIEGIYHPTIFRSIVSDKVYAVSGGNWVEIPPDMTFEEVQRGWVNTMPKPKKAPEISKKIESSRGKGSYTVSHKNGAWSCTCSGFGYRRKCSHIDKLKKEYE